MGFYPVYPHSFLCFVLLPLKQIFFSLTKQLALQKLDHEIETLRLEKSSLERQLKELSSLKKEKDEEIK